MELFSSRLAFLTSRSFHNTLLANERPHHKADHGAPCQQEVQELPKGILPIAGISSSRVPHSLRITTLRSMPCPLCGKHPQLCRTWRGSRRVNRPISASCSCSPAASSSNCDILAAIKFEASFGSVVFFPFPFFEAFDPDAEPTS
jgi:hypothetical protein